MSNVVDYKWNDEYIVNILKNELEYNENDFPFTQLGIIMFLAHKGIDLYVWKPRYCDDYIWCGVEKCFDETRDIFSQDLTEYKVFDDTVNAAIVEGVCYLSLLKEKDELELDKKNNKK